MNYQINTEEYVTIYTLLKVGSYELLREFVFNEMFDRYTRLRMNEEFQIRKDSLYKYLSDMTKSLEDKVKKQKKFPDSNFKFRISNSSEVLKCLKYSSHLGRWD